jgi:mono/diheme cytochrome c family protein
MLAGSNAIAADGAAIYGKKCKSCHGADGSGNTKMGKKLKCRDLSNAAVQAKLTDTAIAKSITDGVSEGGKVRMKPITGLSAADIQAVVKYVRTLKK